jgi:hypothetical protein
LQPQFGDDRLEQIGIKDAGGLAEAAQTGLADAEFLLDLAQVTGLDQAAQAADDGIEEKQQLQGNVLVEVQDAVAGPVPRGAGVVQPIQQGQDLAEVFEVP